MHDHINTPKMTTSVQLAAMYGLERDQMEGLLTELGLRGPGHDGSSTYSAAEVSRLSAERDARSIERIVGFLDGIGDEYAERILREVFAERLLDPWEKENTEVLAQVDAARRSVKGLLVESHRVRRARVEKDRASGEQRAAAAWAWRRELEEFRDLLVETLHARRTPPKPQDASVPKTEDPPASPTPTPQESPTKGRGKRRAGRPSDGNVRGGRDEHL